MEYNECANPNCDPEGPWCATTVEADGITEKLSSYCEDDCCTDDSDCGNGVCGDNNRCRDRCVGGNVCCSQGINGDCKEGEGDCDDDRECEGSLVCGKDNCVGQTFDSDNSYDCCVAACKTEDDEFCHFPFDFDGKEYNACISGYPGTAGKPWCGTSDKVEKLFGLNWLPGLFEWKNFGSCDMSNPACTPQCAGVPAPADYTTVSSLRSASPTDQSMGSSEKVRGIPVISH